jgi:predicted RNA-binding protein with RPS1 domain
MRHFLGYNTDVVKEGDKLKVKVLEISQGKIRLSHKAVLEEKHDQ